MKTGARRVLVVDDDEDSVDAMVAAFQILGCEAHFALSGNAAMTAFRAVDPELVCLDLTLPDISGFELARLVREGTQNRDAVLVAVSGHCSPEFKARTREVGFDAHFTKPIELDKLREILRLKRTPA